MQSTTRLMIRKKSDGIIWGWLLVSLLLMSGCSSSPQMVQGGATVQVAPHTSVVLPKVDVLGCNLMASQLISATWQNKTQQLPVQLQIKNQQLILAGFSSWGTRLLSLRYVDNTLTTDVMVGLGSTLPQPEQVLFNLMLTLWPVNVWQPNLNQIGWSMVEKGAQRVIYDQQKKAVITIRYGDVSSIDAATLTLQDRLDLPIYFQHNQLSYQIKIVTLSHQCS